MKNNRLFHMLLLEQTREGVNWRLIQHPYR